MFKYRNSFEGRLNILHKYARGNFTKCSEELNTFVLNKSKDFVPIG